jgi:hypothetical protein
MFMNPVQFDRYSTVAPTAKTPTVVTPFRPKVVQEQLPEASRDVEV